MSTNQSNRHPSRNHSDALRKLLSSPYARLPKSCTECRRRKKSCEGGVPGCDNCQKRGTVNLCKYGDERDEMGSKNQDFPPSTQERSSYDRMNSPEQYPSFNTSILPSQDTSRLERLSNAAIESDRLERRHPNDEDHNMRSDDPVEPNLSLQNKDCMPKWKSHLTSSVLKLPRKWQADYLIDLHHRELSFGGLMLLDEVNLTKSVYSRGGQSDDIRATEDGEENLMNINDADPSSIALVLVICASALHMLPTSLTSPIMFGSAFSTNSSSEMADLWTQLAVEYFDEGDLYRRPKFETFEALVLYEYNLLNIGNRYNMIHRLDIAVRIGRILGLDKLGSADDDQKRWEKLDRGENASPATTSELNSDIQRHERTTDRLVSSVPLNTFASGEWASRTFAARDHRRRECGRSLWSLLTLRDWNSGPQAGGTYNTHPSTFTTQWPKVTLVHTWKHSEHSCSHGHRVENGTDDVEETEPWQYIAKAADYFRQFIDLSGEAAVYNEEVSYENMLKLDKSLMDLLESRPEWIRPETGASRWRFGIHSNSGKDECKELIEFKYKYVPMFESHMDQCCSLMNLLSSTLWHKLFIIHRPFLSRSLSQPDIYGLTQHRTIYGALLLLESCNQYFDEFNSTVLLFRLQHAAIALISMLLLQGTMFPNAKSREAASRTTLVLKERSDSFTSLSSLNFDSLRIHKGLTFAIQALKSHSQKIAFRQNGERSGNSIFHGLGDALEQLLNYAGRMEWRQRRSNSKSPNIHVTKQNLQIAYDYQKIPQRTAVQSEPDLSVASKAMLSDSSPSNDLRSLNSGSPAAGMNDFPARTPNGNELIQNHSVSQLDQDLFRLLGGQDFAQMTGNGLDQNLPSFNSNEAPMTSSLPYSQAPFIDGSLPERPPWVQEGLWQSIFDTLNNLNTLNQLNG